MKCKRNEDLECAEFHFIISFSHLYFTQSSMQIFQRNVANLLINKYLNSLCLSVLSSSSLGHFLSRHVTWHYLLTLRFIFVLKYDTTLLFCYYRNVTLCSSFTFDSLLCNVTLRYVMFVFSESTINLH